MNNSKIVKLFRPRPYFTQLFTSPDPVHIYTATSSYLNCIVWVISNYKPGPVCITSIAPVSTVNRRVERGEVEGLTMSLAVPLVLQFSIPSQTVVIYVLDNFTVTVFTYSTLSYLLSTHLTVTIHEECQRKQLISIFNVKSTCLWNDNNFSSEEKSHFSEVNLIFTLHFKLYRQVFYLFSIFFIFYVWRQVHQLPKFHSKHLYSIINNLNVLFYNLKWKTTFVQPFTILILWKPLSMLPDLFLHFVVLSGMLRKLLLLWLSDVDCLVLFVSIIHHHHLTYHREQSQVI